jgi:endonuclease YncB( thermonuclease family)
MFTLALRHLFCALAFSLLSLTAGAATWLTGQISWVSDGDTVWLRPDAGQNLGKVQLNKGRVKLRLEAIDAPESCQDWGKEAGTALQDKVLHQPVRAQLLYPDSYGRWLARLYLPQSHHVDVNAWLVAQGHAWDYQFTGGKAGRYAPLQAQAKAARRGLWSLPQPQQPQQFRRQHGACDYGIATTDLGRTGGNSHQK